MADKSTLDAKALSKLKCTSGMELNIDLKLEGRGGCSIASTDTAYSQHRLWITPIIIRAGWLIED
ncbi:hypothetical protein L195_g029264 [Trifolium pratense]|uniref:Uncharacterized protein n=1 Tax=Trifolium pratense TaxID=57577 RepID=A0A2K3L4B1_TRIPR|nr:hypothetical protein L195_g029264 [Trifolium pratense]